MGCGCGRSFSTHACPSVVFVGLFEPIPTLPFVDGLVEVLPS